MIVAKFGGTSVGSADAMRHVAEIVQSSPDRRLVVVSAMSGVTDQLLALSEQAAAREDVQDQLAALQATHQQAVQELNLDVDLQPLFKELERLLGEIRQDQDTSSKKRDHILSFGERLSATIVSALLATQTTCTHVDAKELIETDSLFSQARVNKEETHKHVEAVLLPLLDTHDRVVITGFIGSDPEGNYTTLGRGGSDYSAAIIAQAVHATGLEIWTDVSGIYTTDPRIIPSARPIPAMSYNEAAELAFFGAKVLHPDTIKPAIHSHIPVYIKNTFSPDDVGTVIQDETDESIKSVTFRRGVVILNICSTRMLEAKGFLHQLFKIFDEHHVAVDAISTSEVSVSLTLNEAPSDALLADLEEIATVRVYDNKALVCLVGEGIHSHPEVLANLFGSLRHDDVAMVSQGASQRNITLVVNEPAVEAIIKQIYATFFF